MNNDENTNKTTWIKKKKNVFSDSSNNIDENFQTMNMKQKVMNAFKKKKTRSIHQENYKNIELLQNIYDVSGNDTTGNDASGNDASSNDASGNKISVNIANNIKEYFTDKDFDGIDKPDPKRKKTVYQNPLIALFQDIFDRIDKFNYNKAKILAQALSDKTNTEKDILLLKYYIALFESIGLSYFAAYNWYFYMFYNENNEYFYDNTTKQYEWSEKKQKELSKTNAIMQLYVFFCNYCIKYTEYLQTTILTFLPPLFLIFNLKARFILLFLFLIIIFFYSSRTLYSIVLDAANMKYNNIFVLIMFLVLLFNYVPEKWFPPKSNNPEDIAMATTESFLITSSLFILVPFFMYRCIRALIILYITVPFGASLLLLYFLYYSIFGILSYNYFNFNKAFKMFNDIYMSIKKSNQPPEIKDFDKDSFLHKFIVVTNNFFESLHRYIIYIVYMIMCLVAMVDYFNYIDSTKLKTNLLIISFTMIIIFGSICVSGFMTHGLSEANDMIVVDHTNKEDDNPTINGSAGMFSNMFSSITNMFTSTNEKK